MNEFIVWDEENGQFVDETECIFKDGTLYKNDFHYIDQVSCDFSMFWSIGKTDIEGKKIYAESSIFEFVKTKEYKLVQLKGFFKYDDFDMAYKIFTSDGEILKMSINIRDIRIVGTLQEYKHLLKAQK